MCLLMFYLSCCSHDLHPYGIYHVVYSCRRTVKVAMTRSTFGTSQSIFDWITFGKTKCVKSPPMKCLLSPFYIRTIVNYCLLL